MNKRRIPTAAARLMQEIVFFSVSVCVAYYCKNVEKLAVIRIVIIGIVCCKFVRKTRLLIKKN